LVDSKVVSDFLLDDLVACRLSKKFGNSLVGLNLLTDGFYDEKGLTLDWDGTIGNRHITMEAGAYYPDALTRGPLIKTVEEPDPADSTHTITREVEIPSCYKDQIYYGAFLSFDLFKTRRQALTLRTGYFELGFRPEYSSLKEYSDPFKDMVKASGDTVSANLYYTRKLSETWFLDLDLYQAQLLEKDFPGTSFSFYNPLQAYQIAFRKQFARQSRLQSELQLGVSWYGFEKYCEGALEKEHSYGTFNLKWISHF
jgi:hypothetical protein